MWSSPRDISSTPSLLLRGIIITLRRDILLEVLTQSADHKMEPYDTNKGIACDHKRSKVSSGRCLNRLSGRGDNFKLSSLAACPLLHSQRESSRSYKTRNNPRTATDRSWTPCLNHQQIGVAKQEDGCVVRFAKPWSLNHNFGWDRSLWAALCVRLCVCKRN